MGLDPYSPVQDSDSEQVTAIIAESQRYHPLGTRIRRLNYEIPEWSENEVDVIAYLRWIREELAAGRIDVETIASVFWRTMGLSTATLESFKEGRLLWGEFQATYQEIGARLLESGDGQSHDFGATGFAKASDFLRPLAYIVIPDDPDHVWGYITPSVDRSIPANLPPRCSFRYLEMDAERVLDELTQDLRESFRRRENEYPQSPAVDQCFEPEYPARTRTGVSIEGPESVPEGEEFLLSSKDTAQLEYGPGYSRLRALPASGEWSVSEYTCENPPTVETDGSVAVVKAPSVLRDCVVEFRRRLRPSLGPEVSEVKRVEILNTTNEGPAVRILRKKDSEGGEIVLSAEASDPNGDPLKYRWEQIGGPEVLVIGRSDVRTIRFRSAPGLETNAAVTFRVTVTDEPAGKRPGEPKSAQATHRVTLKAGLSDGTDGVAAFEAPENLVDRLIEAVTPEEVVESIDVMILLDASESLLEDSKRVQKEMERIVEQLRLKVKDGDLSRVRIGIASYVNNEYIVHRPLGPVDLGGIRSALGDVIKRMREGGGRETLWDALYETLDSQQWKQGDDTTRMLVFVTDEDAATGKLFRTRADVERLAAEKKVKVDAVFIIEKNGLSADFLAMARDLEILYNIALAIPVESDRIEFIKRNYFPKYKEFFKKFPPHQKERKGLVDPSAYDSYQWWIKYQFSSLLVTIKKPEARFELARELLNSLGQGDYWRGRESFVIDVYELFGGAILGIGDAEKRLKLGQRWLLDFDRFMGADSWQGPDFSKFSNFAAELAISIPDERDRINFIRRVYSPVMFKRGPWAGEETDIIRVFSTIRNPQERLAVMKESLRAAFPNVGPDHRDADAITRLYGQVVLTHPDEGERMRLGGKLLKDFKSEGYRKNYAYDLTMSMSVESMRIRGLTEVFLPLHPPSWVKSPALHYEERERFIGKLTTILETLGGHELRKRIADQYILPLVNYSEEDSCPIADYYYQSYITATGVSHLPCK